MFSRRRFLGAGGAGLLAIDDLDQIEKTLQGRASYVHLDAALFGRRHNAEYIHHVPGTITCSRDAVKPAEFYYFTTSAARTKQIEAAQLMLGNAEYLRSELNRNFPALSAAKANPLSNTVYFKSPGDAIVKKYSLATMTLEHDGKTDEYAHVVVMPHVTKEVLAELLTDLGKS